MIARMRRGTAHKTCLAQIQLTGNADIEVEADGGDQIAGCGDQKTCKKTGQVTGLEHDLENDVCDGDHCIGDGPCAMPVVQKDTEDISFFFHKITLLP